MSDYVPENDVFEQLPDGRVVQVAFKGGAMSRGEAERLGLIKAEQPVRPSEVKRDATTLGTADGKLPSEGAKQPKRFAGTPPVSEAASTAEVAPTGTRSGAKASGGNS